MKKITFILLALITGTAFGQTEASAAAAADIVSPLTIVQAADLTFGKVTNTGGTVNIYTDNTYDGTATRVGTTVPAAAAFTVNAALNYGYSVTLPTGNEITLTNQTSGGSETMTVSGLNHNSDGTGDGADETFQVGGTLTVNASQVVGNYTGTVTVSVAYE